MRPEATIANRLNTRIRVVALAPGGVPSARCEWAERENAAIAVAPGGAPDGRCEWAQATSRSSALDAQPAAIQDSAHKENHFINSRARVAPAFGGASGEDVRVLAFQ